MKKTQVPIQKQWMGFGLIWLVVSHSDLLLRLPEGAVECKACEEIQKYLVQRARLRLSVDDAVFIWGGHKLWDTRKVNLLLHKRLKLDFLLTQEKMAQIHGNLNEYMMQAETVLSVFIAVQGNRI